MMFKIRKFCMVMKSVLTVVFFITCLLSNAQKASPNGFVEAQLPKTPESQSFQKYGDQPVDEYTGVPGISVPLASVSGNSIEIPITLSYHASGIKVNQEATWVGLGFDIISGGRITIDVKGNSDEIVYNSITSTSTFQNGIK